MDDIAKFAQSQIDAIDNTVLSKQLVDSILQWWNEHEYDVTGEHGDYNLYSEEPSFVVLAKKLKENYDKKQ